MEKKIVVHEKRLLLLSVRSPEDLSVKIRHFSYYVVLQEYKILKKPKIKNFHV